MSVIQPFPHNVQIWDGLTPPYRTIVADPPWSYRRSKGIQGAIDDEYSTMSGYEIAALPVGDLATKDAHLYLWATTPKLWDRPTPAEIVEAWGFQFRTLITWVKGERLGLGWYYRVDTEHCLFATRGKAPIRPELRESNVLWSPRSAHSAKPAAFYDLVQQVSPAPYIELFCRAPIMGWDSWGKGYEGADRCPVLVGSAPLEHGTPGKRNQAMREWVPTGTGLVS